MFIHIQQQNKIEYNSTTNASIIDCLKPCSENYTQDCRIIYSQMRIVGFSFQFSATVLLAGLFIVGLFSNGWTKSWGAYIVVSSAAVFCNTISLFVILIIFPTSVFNFSNPAKLNHDICAPNSSNDKYSNILFPLMTVFFGLASIGIAFFSLGFLSLHLIGDKSKCEQQANKTRGGDKANTRGESDANSRRKTKKKKPKNIEDDQLSYRNSDNMDAASFKSEDDVIGSIYRKSKPNNTPRVPPPMKAPPSLPAPTRSQSTFTIKI